MKNIYAFDIDGVLCCTRESHKIEIEQELGVTLFEDGEYDTWGFSHDSDEVMDFLRSKALDLWLRPTVLRGGVATGQEVLGALDLRGQMAGYVTRRDPRLYGHTLRWLADHHFALGEIGYFTNTEGSLRHERLRHMGSGQPKCRAAATLGATHLIEDSPAEALQSAVRIAVVVLRRPYNRNFEHSILAQQAEANQFGVHSPALNISFISSLEELL